MWTRIRKETSNFEPDVVWANDESLLMAARMAGLNKIVTTMHGLAREAIEAEREVMGTFDWAISKVLLDRFTRKALKHASVITTYSNYLRSRIKSLYSPKVPIYAVPNGVDPALFHPVDTERQNVITYVGRFARIKGVHTLLRAMKIVRAKYPNWKLWLVGDTFDQSMEYFKSIYNEGVTWTGYIPHENLLDIWKQSKIGVAPSWGEGFEIALMEAVASGVPSITTEASERREIYKNLVTFCALNSATDLADKIIHVIENWEEQHKKALRASELARKKYSWDHIANDYLRILKNML
jgi:glycosyltransferase involved in cell wall biosynthesis